MKTHHFFSELFEETPEYPAIGVDLSKGMGMKTKDTVVIFREVNKWQSILTCGQ